VRVDLRVRPDIPKIVQWFKTMETHRETPKLRYAGFWIRLLAFVIDWMILGIIGYFVGATQVEGNPDFSAKVSYTGWKAIIPIAYFFLFWVRFSATPGKLICGLRIVESDGRKLSWGKALLRLVSYVPSGVVLLLGFIWVGFDRHKQGWHDKIAGTYVVKAENLSD